MGQLLKLFLPPGCFHLGGDKTGSKRIFLSNGFSFVISRLGKPDGRNVSLENSALVGYYTASGGNFLPTFRDISLY